MTIIIISLLLLASLLPHLTFTAHVNVGIVDGTEARPNSRPYMVSLQTNGQHICGGFLLSDEFVLTAAQCRNGGEDWTVVVGAHDHTGSSHMNVKFYHIHSGVILEDLCGATKLQLVSQFNDLMMMEAVLGGKGKWKFQMNISRNRIA
ncbi:unnamed protein product [Leuciscus chuanchicus]